LGALAAFVAWAARRRPSSRRAEPFEYPPRMPDAATPPSRNPALAKSAAADPNRPGEACKAAPGSWQVQVDRGRCEGKNACVEVCPYNVFEVRRIDDADFDALGFFAKLKSRA